MYYEVTENGVDIVCCININDEAQNVEKYSTSSSNSIVKVSYELARRGCEGLQLLVIAGLLGCLILSYKLDLCQSPDNQFRGADKPPSAVSSNQGVITNGRELPLIFIGGVPRSGTTLMRAMLDAHPDVRCGQETRVIPRILHMRNQIINSKNESFRLEQAGVNREVLDSAIASFCLEVITRHASPAPRPCSKDPLTLRAADYLSELFPQAKFIFMVRDGRATVHSIISRQVGITGFDLSSYRQSLQKWNEFVSTMYDQCQLVGPGRCMMVFYEQLVLHPAYWMREILDFLDVPWNESVLHHEDQINKPGGVLLSKLEFSTDQVIKPVNLEGLTKWVGHLPQDVLDHMDDLAPMLANLGYDPHANPPNYGSPDAVVVENTRRIRDQRPRMHQQTLPEASGVLKDMERNSRPQLTKKPLKHFPFNFPFAVPIM